MRIVTPGHGLGGPGDDDLPATHPSLGSEIDHVVRALHHVEVVLDEQNRVPNIHQAAQNLE